MNVRFANDGLHRFFVSAGGSDPEMEGEEYTVDLDHYRGLGECGCKRWSCKVWPNIRDGKRPIDLFDKAFSCSHIRAAREYQQERVYRNWFRLVLKIGQPVNT